MIIPARIGLLLSQVEIPSAKTVDSTFGSIIYFGVIVAVIVLATAFGLQHILKTLEKFGLIKSGRNDHGGNDSNGFKRLGDLTVESFESKIRHAMRNELQILIGSISKLENALHELKDTNTAQLGKINESLVRLIAIEETRNRFAASSK